jgi:predicted nucleic acid-binding protein
LILGDSSAWIDHLRRRRTRPARRIDELLEGTELVTTDPVVMEVLAGAKDMAHRRTLLRLLSTRPHVPVAVEDWTAAADIYRDCRRGGTTPRTLVDCLIAAVAMRTGAAVLHNDRDFDLIARHVDLAIDR